MGVSISFKKATKQTSIKHNNREFSEKDWQSKFHEHIDKKRTDKNVILKQEYIQDSYVKLFQEEVDKYNKKQKRRDRRIKNFYEYVCKKNKNLEPQREFLVQVGEMADFYNTDGSLNTEMYTKANDILIDYYSKFQERNPNLYVYNAVIHNDEATPHLHLNVIPIGSDYKKGVNKRPSFDRALKQQNLEYDKQDSRSLFNSFRQQEIDKIEQSVRSCQLERKIVGTNNIKDVHQFKREMEKVDHLKTKKHFLELETNKLQRNVDRALELLHPEDLKLDEEPKKTLFGDKVTISQQDFYKLQDSYTEFSKLSLKLEESEKAFEQTQQLHQKEIQEMQAKNLKVVKELKQAYKQEKQTLEQKHESELKTVTDTFTSQLNESKVINDVQAEQIYDLREDKQKDSVVIRELQTENSSLKEDNKQLTKDNRILKMKLDIVTKQLQTAKDMFKDIVQISREHKELLHSTVSKFIERQSDRLIKACEKSKDNISIDYFKRTIDETFADDTEKSKAIKRPVVEKYNNHIDEINAEIERKRQAKLEKERERERKRELERQKELEREREREEEWGMTL